MECSRTAGVGSPRLPAPNRVDPALAGAGRGRPPPIVGQFTTPTETTVDPTPLLTRSKRVPDLSAVFAARFELRDLDERLAEARCKLAAAQTENAAANGNPDTAFITDRGERAWNNLCRLEREIKMLTARHRALAAQVEAGERVVRSWMNDLLDLGDLRSANADVEKVLAGLLRQRGSR